MQTLCRLMYWIITGTSLLMRLASGVPSTVDGTNALSVRFHCSVGCSDRRPTRTIGHLLPPRVALTRTQHIGRLCRSQFPAFTLSSTSLRN